MEREHLKEEPVGNGKKQRDPMTSILGELSYAPVINDSQNLRDSSQQSFSSCSPKGSSLEQLLSQQGKKATHFRLGALWFLPQLPDFQVTSRLLRQWKRELAFTASAWKWHSLVFTVHCAEIVVWLSQSAKRAVRYCLLCAQEGGHIDLRGH